ncbi:MAG TPA: hypothetical protein VJ508_08255, partial [Saprospiraceae bacterium]|nr:hypothetical protein [Saprospiraceae bacterium]
MGGTGCKQAKAPSTEDETATTQDTLPKDFIEFYDRFHRDTAYQMAHINFPLEGLPNSQNDTVSNPTERFYWQRSTWIKHNPFTDPSQQFDQWFETPTDRVVEHWIHMKGTNLFLHRRFAKLDDGWYLIYYAGMR